MNILIADDEEYMVKIVKAYFEKEGFTTYTAKDGQEALNMVYNEQIDLAILDWMMPQVSGIEVCKEIKANSTVKVLMLTAKGEIDDELYALQAGVDDYVRKPFDPRILLVRAKKMLHLDGQYTFGQIKVDLEAQKIYHAGRDLHVTNKEFQLMKYFVQHEGKVLTRKALLDHVWGFDYFGEERTVDTHIRRLREKIGDNWIKTHRGMGYSFENPDK
ncbi:DNA-binding response regulator [Brevibacillus brevis X23]|nr:DNA-binding response regulator [Brevibacillus brevis X23]